MPQDPLIECIPKRQRVSNEVSRRSLIKLTNCEGGRCFQILSHATQSLIVKSLFAHSVPGSLLNHFCESLKVEKQLWKIAQLQTGRQGLLQSTVSHEKEALAAASVTIASFSFDFFGKMKISTVPHNHKTMARRDVIDSRYTCLIDCTVNWPFGWIPEDWFQSKPQM